MQIPDNKHNEMLQNQPSAISIQNFCKRFDISINTAYREISDGKIKPVKIRGKTCFDMQEVARWYESAKATTSTIENF